MANAFTLFLYDLAYYYFNKHNYNYGFNYILKILGKFSNRNNKLCVIKSVELYERFRKYASNKVDSTYKILISNYEKENRTIVSMY